MDKPTHISRRTVLKSVPVAATLLASPDGPLTRHQARAAEASFPQPPVWDVQCADEAQEAILEGTLDVRFTTVEIPGFGRATTRTYNGAIPGPTLRLRGGDTLRLTQINGLPPNEPFSGDHNVPHDFNTFNLHTHGLHVSPGGRADNVFRAFVPRAPGETEEPRYLSEIHIPRRHPAGTFWYHPHYHGSVSEQIAGGMSGVLIVEGDVDRVPEIAAAADVVVCINELKLVKQAEPGFTSDASLTAPTPIFTVNGAVNPAITLRPGEVQRWRLVGATAFTPLLLSIGGDLPSPAMVQIAQDGVTFAAPVRTAEVPLAMGGRADVLIRADRPGTYELRAHGQPKPLMTIEVAGDRIEPPMRFPAKLPPGKPPLDEAEIAEVSVHREVVWHVDRGVFPAPFPNAYRILGTHPTPMADPSGDPKTDPKYGRFDPGFVNHTLRRGAVERWTIRTDEQMPSLFHPFHLHTNHVLVTHRNGKKLDPPVWHDTIGIPGGKPGDSVTFLVKYEDFVGRAVLHCHLLAHEDLGMMQIVEYVP